MRSLLIIIVTSCCVIVVAVAVGLLQPGLMSATLRRHAEHDVMRCMREAGFGQERKLIHALTTGQAWSPHAQALKRCWSDTANEARFRRLALPDPVALEQQDRNEGFRTWRCAERAGYVRTTKIPLSGPGGYPLQLAAGNFRVGSSERALERFYRVAARCSGERLDAYRWSDGTFSPDPADGRRCVRHDHRGSGLHAHGCYGAATYPAGAPR